MVGRGLAGSNKAGVDFMIGCNAVCIVLGCKGVDEDGIGAVEGNHDILVAIMGVGVEASSVIGEDVGEGEFVESNGIGSEVQEGWQGWQLRTYAGLGGTDVLPWLCHVPHVSCIHIQTVACHQRM